MTSRRVICASEPVEEPLLVHVEFDPIGDETQRADDRVLLLGLELGPAIVTRANRLETRPEPLLSLVFTALELHEPQRVAHDFDLVVPQVHLATLYPFSLLTSRFLAAGGHRCERAPLNERTEMSVTLLRHKVKDDTVEEAEAAVHELFATLDRVRPEGLRYASTRVANSSTFVILVEVADGVDDPRPAIPEFARFLEKLKDWVEGPPVIVELDVVGTYNLFEGRRQEAAVRQV
jgi:hypothetical protein